MSILEVYKQYQIMPQLQQHQLRVAAVAKQICDNLDQPVDSKSVITACLLHDMGNILKFDLTKFPKFLEPEGLSYWDQVKEDFRRKYGEDDHRASLAVVKELKQPSRIVELVDGVGFRQAVTTVNKPDLEQKICNYADMRVAPHGVVSLGQRLADGRQRYLTHKDYQALTTDENDKALQSIERTIFAQAKIKPADITDQSIAPISEDLKAWQI